MRSTGEEVVETCAGIAQQVLAGDTNSHVVRVHALPNWTVVDVRPGGEVVESVAERLAQALPADLLIMAVEDSDSAVLALLRDGRIRDSVSVGHRREEDEPPRPNADEWVPLLVDPNNRNLLDQAVPSDLTFAEEYLFEFAPLIGIDLELVLAGDAVVREFDVVVCREEQQWPYGPVRDVFALQAGEVGTPLTVTVWIPPSEPETTLVLRGNALNEGIVKLKGARRLNRPCDIHIADDASYVRVLPVDLDETMSSIHMPRHMQLAYQEQSDEMAASMAAVSLELEGLAPGEATLDVAAGGWQHSVTITVRPRYRRPLRGVVVSTPFDAELAASKAARALAPGPYLETRITFAPPVDRAAAAAAPLVEWWLDRFDRPHRWRLFVEWHDGEQHLSNVNAKKRHRTASWKKLHRLHGFNVDGAVLEDPDAFTPEVQPGPGFGWVDHQPEGGWWDQGVLDGGSELVLWVAPTAQQDDELRTELIERIDGCCNDAEVQQAYVVRTGATPSSWRSHYENVTGVWGQIVIAPFWASRWLRGVGDLLWLGAPLLQHLDTTALAILGDVTWIGGSARLSLDPGASLDELEALLEPVLPSHDDWRSAVVTRDVVLSSEIQDHVEQARRVE